MDHGGPAGSRGQGAAGGLASVDARVFLGAPHVLEVVKCFWRYWGHGRGRSCQSGSGPKMPSVCRRAVKPFHGCIADTGLTLCGLDETRIDCYTASNFIFFFVLAYSTKTVEEEGRWSLVRKFRTYTFHDTNLVSRTVGS